MKKVDPETVSIALPVEAWRALLRETWSTSSRSRSPRWAHSARKQIAEALREAGIDA